MVYTHHFNLKRANYKSKAYLSIILGLILCETYFKNLLNRFSLKKL